MQVQNFAGKVNGELVKCGSHPEIEEFVMGVTCRVAVNSYFIFVIPSFFFLYIYLIYFLWLLFSGLIMVKPIVAQATVFIVMSSWLLA